MQLHADATVARGTPKYSHSMTYDACGNMTRQEDGIKNLVKEMAYDSSNRIKTVTNPGNGEVVGRYFYDDGGFRVLKISKREDEGLVYTHAILYPSQYIGVEVQVNDDNSEVADSYAVVNNIYMNGVRVAALTPSGESRYYLTDQVDSVKVVTDKDGKPMTRMEYLPYGEAWFTEGDGTNAPKFNSQELDEESGFYFYNARYYDASICRFVTADNVIDGEGDTQGWNRYSYTKGNPIRYKDPTGHFLTMNAIKAMNGEDGRNGIDYIRGSSDQGADSISKGLVEQVTQEAKQSMEAIAPNPVNNKDSVEASGYAIGYNNGFSEFLQGIGSILNGRTDSPYAQNILSSNNRSDLTDPNEKNPGPYIYTRGGAGAQIISGEDGKGVSGEIGMVYDFGTKESLPVILGSETTSVVGGSVGIGPYAGLSIASGSDYKNINEAYRGLFGEGSSFSVLGFTYSSSADGKWNGIDIGTGKGVSTFAGADTYSYDGVSKLNGIMNEENK